MAGLDLLVAFPGSYVNKARVVSTAAKDFSRPLFRVLRMPPIIRCGAARFAFFPAKSYLIVAQTRRRLVQC
jgi:hypothetical protein